uniref:Ataxin-10 domain-containing protein n=1 Tax=Oncorhynchus tshawytscha TaxID=74940 RepID=A0A8C8CPD6_ONCTS
MEECGNISQQELLISANSDMFTNISCIPNSIFVFFFQVRELDGLPLIMDNCVIESNNPCWAIFATRNILDHNLVNQELVVALECCGLADDSSLRAMGLRVKERDGIMLLKPCSKDP